MLYLQMRWYDGSSISTCGEVCAWRSGLPKFSLLCSPIFFFGQASTIHLGTESACAAIRAHEKGTGVHVHLTYHSFLPSTLLYHTLAF